MNVIEILIYGLALLEFPYDESKGNCGEQANLIFSANDVEHISTIDPPTYWAEGDYWNAEDGKQYRIAGFRCVNKETGQELGRTRNY